MRNYVRQILERGGRVLATGFWGGESELDAQRQTDTRFEPKLAAADVAARRGRWKDAVERSRRWNA